MNGAEWHDKLSWQLERFILTQGRWELWCAPGRVWPLQLGWFILTQGRWEREDAGE